MPAPWPWWDFLSGHSCSRIRQWGLCRYKPYFWLCRRTCRRSSWCRDHLTSRQVDKEPTQCQTEDKAPQSAAEAGLKPTDLTKGRAAEVSENRQIWWWDLLSQKSCLRIRNWGLCRWRPYFWLCSRTCRRSPWCKSHSIAATGKLDQETCKTDPDAPLSPEDAGIPKSELLQKE